MAHRVALHQEHFHVTHQIKWDRKNQVEQKVVNDLVIYPDQVFVTAQDRV